MGGRPAVLRWGQHCCWPCTAPRPSAAVGSGPCPPLMSPWAVQTNPRVMHRVRRCPEGARSSPGGSFITVRRIARHCTAEVRRVLVRGARWGGARDARSSCEAKVPLPRLPRALPAQRCGVPGGFGAQGRKAPANPGKKERRSWQNGLIKPAAEGRGNPAGPGGAPVPVPVRRGQRDGAPRVEPRARGGLARRAVAPLEKRATVLSRAMMSCI